MQAFFNHLNLSAAENSSNFNSLDFLETYVAQYWPVAIINFILSLPTNGYVLWLIATTVGRTMASEFFALNLAVSEILNCTIYFMAFVTMFLNTDIFMDIGKFNAGLMYTSRLLFQCCICMEQYLGVVHPIVFLRYKPLRYRVACCTVVWVLVLGSSLFCLLGSYLHGFLHVYLVQYLLLLLVQLFCCLSVLRALKQPGPGEGNREKERTHDVKRRAFNTILITLVASTLTNIAYAFTVSLEKCLTRESFNLAVGISSSFGMTTGFVHPLIYLYRAGKLPCIKALSDSFKWKL